MKWLISYLEEKIIDCKKALESYERSNIERIDYWTIRCMTLSEILDRVKYNYAKGEFINEKNKGDL